MAKKTKIKNSSGPSSSKKTIGAQGTPSPKKTMTVEESLRLAFEKAQKAMINKPSKDNVENFTSAQEALDAFLERKAELEKEKQFKNILEVVDYLKNQEWKIEKSKAYQDKKAGKIKAQPDGTFLLADVERYIVRAELKKADCTDPVEDTQTRKSNASAEKEEAQARWWILKAEIEEGKYVPKEQMERELSARAAFLRTDFENFFRGHSAEMVTIAHGDQSKTPEFLAFCLEAVADWLDRYEKQKSFSIPNLKATPT